MGMRRKSKSSRGSGSSSGKEANNKHRHHHPHHGSTSRDIDTADSGFSGGGGGGPKYSNSDPYSPTSTDNSSISGGTGPDEEMARNRGKGDTKGPWFTARQIKLFRKPPPAEQSAYAGPPRYDWVDIETSAAIKIQAAYRRRRVMSMMEEEGQTTAAVRNMARRRQAAREATTNPAQDFINLFNCCGVDFALGGGHKETFWDFTRELETARYTETTREKAQREELLRRKYQRKPPRENLVENVEVVQ